MNIIFIKFGLVLCDLLYSRHFHEQEVPTLIGNIIETRRINDSISAARGVSVGLGPSVGLKGVLFI